MKVNVAHVFLTLNMGGMEKVCLDIIRRMDRERFNHHIICLSEIGTFGEAFEEKDISITLIKKKPGFDFSILSRLRQFFKENNIQVVHSNNPAPHFWAGIAAKLSRVPARINTKHGRNFIWLKRRVLLNRMSAVTSHKIVCVSKDSADLTKRIEKVPAGKVCVISNGVDTQQFRDDLPPCAQLSHELELEKDSQVIGSIARFSHDKDHDTLIKAFARLKPAYPNTILLLVGDGETMAMHRELVEKLNIQSSVRFLGARKDVIELISLMDIYVLSSHTEGISISLLEAMSCGKTCVASEVGGCPEIIEDGENGYLVPAADEKSLHQCLTDRIDQIGKERSLQARARQTVIDRYSLDVTVAKYESLYEELLGT